MFTFAEAAAGDARAEHGLGQATQLGHGEHLGRLLPQCVHPVHGRRGTGHDSLPVVPLLLPVCRLHRPGAAIRWQGVGALWRRHLKVVDHRHRILDDQARVRREEGGGHRGETSKHTAQPGLPIAAVSTQRPAQDDGQIGARGGHIARQLTARVFDLTDFTDHLWRQCSQRVSQYTEC